MGWHSIETNIYRYSISVNELIIPGRLIEDHLTQYCTSLGVWSGNENYPIYIPGSATLIRYKGRYFMICTRHQLKGTPNFEKVCLLLPYGEGQTQCITSGGVRWFDKINDGDDKEVVVFDFTEPCREIPELKRLFFDFRGQHQSILASKIVAFITFGYVTSLANFDYGNGKIEQVKARVLSSFAAPGFDDALHIIAPISPLEFDPDGMSGGPTFCVVQDRPGEFSAHFAGVTVRGSPTTLMLIKAGAVQAVLNTVIKDRLPNVATDGV